jgi:hypothetical protein
MLRATVIPLIPHSHSALELPSMVLTNMVVYGKIISILGKRLLYSKVQGEGAFTRDHIDVNE